MSALECFETISIVFCWVAIGLNLYGFIRCQILSLKLRRAIKDCERLTSKLTQRLGLTKPKE